VKDSARQAAINMEQTLLDPASVFATPEAVLVCESLSKAQKIEILRRWAYDASENGVATEEGMPNGESDLLHCILVALDRLAGEIDVEQVGPTKQHGIPRSAVKS
jgi:hypothetical protein